MMEDIFKRECAGGNPLAQMMNQFNRDATGREKLDLAMDAPHVDEFQEFLTGGAPREVFEAHAQTRDFFGIDNIDDLDPTFAGPREFHAEHGEFDHMLQGPPRPGMLPQQEKDRHLHSLLGDFIHSAKSGQGFAPVSLPDLGMTNLEKQKIRNRSNVVARHVNPDQKPLVDAQLGALFESLSINGQRAMERPRDVGGEWAGEFEANQRADQWATEFHNHQRHHHPWVQGYNEWQQEMERRTWAQEYEHFDERQYRNMQNAWKQSVDEGWRNEFERVKDTLDDKINYSKYLEGLNDNEREAELRHLGKLISQVDDPKLQASKFMQMMAAIGEGALKVEGNSLVETQTTTTTTTPTTTTAPQPNQSTTDHWLSQYEDFVPPSFGELDFSEFERDFSHLFPSTHYESILGPLRPYDFQENNPYLDHPNPMEKGKELFDRGELGDAILAFEAVVQKELQNSEGWRRLGLSHAENDRDDRAISSLSRACTLDPDDAEALLALAVSCTNDSYKDQALLVLKSWLEHHPRYRDHHEKWMEMFDDLDLQDLTTAMFIEAAKLAPLDPDENVQIALGLLFNISQEYDKAVDCFRTALTKRPDDYLLWNKLGATLANSGHSKAALEPYYKSLSIKPTYTRARANLGISYLNLELYDEAATQFLSALALQPAAKHIWMNLQTVFSRMNRDDLLEKSLRYDVELFKGDFSY